MGRFELGKEYAALINGQRRIFKVIEKKGQMYYGVEWFLIRWDDGEEENATATDMIKWHNESMII